MKRCFVLRKYIFFRWGKKILNKALGATSLFVAHRFGERCGRFLFRCRVGGRAFWGGFLFPFHGLVGF